MVTFVYLAPFFWRHRFYQSAWLVSYITARQQATHSPSNPTLMKKKHLTPLYPTQPTYTVHQIPSWWKKNHLTPLYPTQPTATEVAVYQNTRTFKTEWLKTTRPGLLESGWIFLLVNGLKITRLKLKDWTSWWNWEMVLTLFIREGKIWSRWSNSHWKICRIAYGEE